MAQTNYTPIQLYYSTTGAAAPTAGNLANGELAINITDGKLFYKDNLGAVQVLATKGGVVGPSSSTDNALVRFDTTTGKLVQNSVGILDDSGNLTGLAAVTMSGALTLSGGTANGVAYLNGSKVLTTGSALTYNGSDSFTFSGSSAAAYNSFVVQNTAANGYSRILFNAGASVGAIKYAPGIFFAIGTDSDSLSTPMVFNLGNASEQMRLTSTGLGIGTSAPGNKLHVIQAKSGSGAESYDLVRLNLSGTNALGDSSNIAWFSGTGSTKVASISGILGADNVAYGTLAFSTRRVTTDTLDEAMRIDNRGNLGLGVTPSAWAAASKAFQIKGTGSAIEGSISAANGTNALSVSSNAYFNAGWKYAFSSGAGRYDSELGAHSWYTAPSGTAGNAITFTQAMTLDASGNLLVGTTAAVERLTIGSGSATSAGVNLRTTQTDFSIVPSNSAAGGVNISTSWVSGGQGPLRFSNSAGEMGRFDSSGNLLVGTTSQISSGFMCLSFANNVRNGIVINDTDTGSGTSAAIIFRRNGSQVGSIVTTTSTTALVGTSDYRLKNSIKPMVGALQKVIALKPCTYKWNVDGSDGEGFIAHELQAVVPDAVVGEKDAVNEDGSIKAQGINTNFLIATLTAAIQELKAEFDAYKSTHP